MKIHCCLTLFNPLPRMPDRQLTMKTMSPELGVMTWLLYTGSPSGLKASHAENKRFRLLSFPMCCGWFSAVEPSWAYSSCSAPSLPGFSSNRPTTSNNSYEYIGLVSAIQIVVSMFVVPTHGYLSDWLVKFFGKRNGGLVEVRKRLLSLRH